MVREALQYTVPMADRRRRSALKVVAIALTSVGLMWLVAGAGLYAAMCQTPATFGAIMAQVPSVAMLVLPFKPLWMSARAGHLAIGDVAPDFTLPMLHGDRRVRLSEEVREKPVVLVFGSYT
jgi:hypothetical protein